jgi:hypothetical protein
MTGRIVPQIGFRLYDSTGESDATVFTDQVRADEAPGEIQRGLQIKIRGEKMRGCQGTEPPP